MSEKKQTLALMLSEWRQVLSEIDASQGELSPGIEARMMALDISVPEKVDAWGFVIDRMVAEEAFWRERAQEAEDMARKYASHREYMKKHLKRVMSENEMRELKGTQTRFVLSRTKPALAIYDKSIVPATFTKEVISIELDKEAISIALESGIEVPGCQLLGGASLRKYTNSKLLE